MGRDALRLRRTQGEYTDADGGRRRRFLPPTHGRLQGAQDSDIRGAAENFDRKNPEVCPAREGQAALRARQAGLEIVRARHAVVRSALQAANKPVRGKLTPDRML